MRMVFGLVLIVGLGLAGFAVYLAKGYVGNYQAELAQERAARAAIVPTTTVYVATRQLKYGEHMAKEDVRAVKWPVNAIPEGAFKDIKALFPKGDNILRSATRIIEKDEAILAAKVTAPGQEAGITAQLAKGKRAFAIKVDVVSGVSGFLRPGNRVDVYWSGESVNQNVTKLIESGVRLIAIDQKAGGDMSEAAIARTVTVEVSPEQVAALAQAQSTGKLSLALVGMGDETQIGAIEVDQNQLLGITQQVVAKAAPARVCTIKTRRGDKVVETPVACTN